jgi:hypothetical protein
MDLEISKRELAAAKELVAELKRWGNHTQIEVQLVQALDHLCRAVQGLVEQAAERR